MGSTAQAWQSHGCSLWCSGQFFGHLVLFSAYMALGTSKLVCAMMPCSTAFLILFHVSTARRTHTSAAAEATVVQCATLHSPKRDQPVPTLLGSSRLWECNILLQPHFFSLLWLAAAHPWWHLHYLHDLAYGHGKCRCLPCDNLLTCYPGTICMSNTL